MLCTKAKSRRDPFDKLRAGCRRYNTVVASIDVCRGHTLKTFFD